MNLKIDYLRKKIADLEFEFEMVKQSGGTDRITTFHDEMEEKIRSDIRAWNIILENITCQEFVENENKIDKKSRKSKNV